MRELISISLLVFGMASNAHAAVEIGDFLQDEFGEYYTAATVSVSQAEEFCKKQGSRLPTAREYAEWASRPCTSTVVANCGAQGIRESEFRGQSQGTAEVDNEVNKNGVEYYFDVMFVDPKQPGKLQIDFYFNDVGFTPENQKKDRPKGAMTSSSYQDLSNITRYYDFFFLLEGSENRISDHDARNSYEVGVRCIL